MAYEIIVKKRFTGKVLKLLNYLEKEWGKPVADNFIAVLEDRIETLSQQPYIGTPSGMKNVRTILISKQNRLYYRIKGEQIEIITLLDTRMNPERNRYRRK
jgi:plasmid stabilization system protein ParE